MFKLLKGKRLWEIGGVIAGVVLIGFGVGSVVMGATGVNTVRDNLGRENIVGTPDSTIPGQKVDTGAEAKAFANVMRKHTLEASGGQVYADMGRYLDEKGNPTSDEALAAKNPDTGRPVDNPLRQLWVTQTALSTALNQAFFAERVAVFGIVVGVALLLSGFGFLVLSLGGAIRREGAAAAAAAPTGAAPPTTTVPAS